ncbi:MAG: hypothetical protein U5L96_03040 [Owenweeksia sp.]|nr:hypothetical protein [Owenweeksia sp.]
MIFSKGDIVAFLNSTGTGRIIDLRQQEALVEDEDGFDSWYQFSELVIRKKMEIGEVPQKDQPISPGRSNRAGFAPNELIKDLHFNQLVAFPKNYTVHQMLQIQLSEARKTIG